jgi:hypothetical protein
MRHARKKKMMEQGQGRFRKDIPAHSCLALHNKMVVKDLGSEKLF